MRLESTSELFLGPTKGGHYNEVVLLKRWPLREVALYNILNWPILESHGFVDLN